MSGLQQKLIRGVVSLLGGQVVGQAAALLRNLIIARALGADSYGIAGLFAVTLRLLEMVSNLSERMVILRDPDADDPEFIGTLHVFSIARGLILALLLILIAGWVSQLFGVPDAQWAFMCLAILPLTRGFINWDVCRLERQMHYNRAVAMETGPQLIGLAAAVLISQQIRDYSAMIWILIIQTTAHVVLSHILAPRRYIVRWARPVAARVLKFGVPLLANGLLLFFITQSDRLILGAEELFPQFSKSALGIYLVVAQLTTIAPEALATVIGRLTLPAFAQSMNKPAMFCDWFIVSLQVNGLVAALHVAMFCTIGHRLVPLLFGEDFIPPFGMVELFAIASGLRLFRSSPTSAALSRGDSITSLLASCVRVTSLVGVLVSALLGQSVLWFLVWAVIAEIASFIFTAWRCQVRHNLRLAVYGGPVFVAITVAAIGPAVCNVVQPLVIEMIAEVLGLAISIGFASIFSFLLLKKHSHVKKFRCAGSEEVEC